MRFTPTPIAGVLLIEPDPASDERGLFARTFDEEAFAANGLVTRWAQCSTSFNAKAGTLRGMHLQREPHGESKLVRCTRGAVRDVALDLRPSSPTFRRWHAVELAADNRLALYVPPGVAHGFQTLADASELLYMIDTPYNADAATGVRWDDPAFRIAWPKAVTSISPRDAAWPDFTP